MRCLLHLDELEYIGWLWQLAPDPLFRHFLAFSLTGKCMKKLSSHNVVEQISLKLCPVAVL